MKTLFVINSLEGGGAERVFCSLVKELEPTLSSNNISVALLDSKEEVYSLPSSVKVIRLGEGNNKFITFIRFLIVIRSIRPECVVSFLTRSNFFNIISSYFSDHKVVISERSNTSGRISGKLSKIKRLLIGFFYRQASSVVSVSNGTKQELVKNYGVPDEMVKVINNPVFIENIINLSNVNYQVIDEKSIVAMGRLVKSKGFDTLIKALSLSGLSNKLYILGAGEERENLGRLVDRLGLVDQVKFLGFLENPYSIISQCEVFVLPSRLEGFPNALVEAMSMGLNVVASDCLDGPREILDIELKINAGEFIVGQYGILFNVDDSLALSKALKLCLDNDISVSGIKEGARNRVSYYSPKVFRNKFLHVLKSN